MTHLTLYSVMAGQTYMLTALEPGFHLRRRQASCKASALESGGLGNSALSTYAAAS